MTKTYISSLLTVLLFGGQLVQAQQSIEDAFAQIDAEENNTVITETDLFSAGIEFFKEGKYDEAEAAFEAILNEDLYHRGAMKYLKKTAQQIGAKGESLQEAVREQAFTDVDEAWNNVPLAREVAVQVAAPEEISPVEETAIDRMTAQLQSLIIDQLDLQDAEISDAVYLLNEKSLQVDPAGEGVNILMLGADSLKNGGSVTITLTDMSLYDALQYISEISALQIDIRAKAVVLSPIGYESPAELKLVSYDVVPEIGEKLAAAAGGSDAEELFGDISVESAGGPVSVEAFFSSLVDWPKGSSAVFHQKFQKLFVKNTSKSIEKIEVILNDLQEEAIRMRSQQVEIEAKFIDFSEGALEELGFDWDIYSEEGKINGELNMLPGETQAKYNNWLVRDDAMIYAGDTFPTPTPSEFVVGERVYTSIEEGYKVVPSPSLNATQTVYPEKAGAIAQNLFGSFKRSNRSAFESVQQGLLNKMGGLPAAMFFEGKSFDLKLTALEQAGSADILSAPKVTTQSGSPAVIKVGEAHRYPQDWQVDTGQATTPALTPQDWEDIYLGVVLDVTPLVDPENNTIDLELEPDIRVLKGKDVYMATAVGEVDADGNAGNFIQPIELIIPYYESRQLKTEVTIADGQTVVLGGLVDERTETFRDQVPILGDIPYLGRLFRTEGTRSAKKSLTIFITATQVDERGLNRKQRDALRNMAAN